MSERFRIADVEIYAVGEDQCLVRPFGGPPRTIRESDARLLASCVDYRSLDEHARSWAAHLEQRRLQAAGQHSPKWLARVLDATAKAVPEPAEKLVASSRATLEELARNGLLTDRSSFPDERPAEQTEPIAALGFTTRRRPAELRRAIESYAANFRRFERSPEVVVIDDSRNQADESVTEDLLEELQQSCGLRMRICGVTEREAYAEVLAREAGVDPAVARFALLGDERCPITTGSARNALLLDGAASRYVLADDDGMCRMTQAPEAEHELDIVSRNDPTQFWFYENREALHEQVELRDDVDLFALHESLLGRPVAQVAGGDADLDGAAPAFEGRLRRHGARVRTTMAGVVGDSGVASTTYIGVERRSRQRLLASEQFYRAAVESRQMLRAPQRTTLSEGFLTMAGNLGVDASELFPPFPPVQRNSDGIMGRFLQHCFPESCRGYLNWAVLHDPAAQRTQSIEAWFADIRSIRFADVLTVLMHDSAGGGATVDPAGALAQIGQRLARLGRGPREKFREELQARIVAREASRLAQLRRADTSGVPEFFASLQRRYIRTMHEAVTDDAYLLPRDLADPTLALTQSVTARLGELLSCWGRLWSAATWLRAEGRRLSRPVAGSSTAGRAESAAGSR